MRGRTMIDRFLAGSICHAFIGRKMEWKRGATVRVRGGGRRSWGGSVKPQGSIANGRRARKTPQTSLTLAFNK